MAYVNSPNDDALFQPIVRMALREDFNKPALKTGTTATIANQHFEILGTNVADADQTMDAKGGQVLTTHGGASDSAIILPYLTATRSPWTSITWPTSKEIWWSTHIATPASITNCTFWAGLKLTNTPVSTTDDDEVFFRFQNGTDTYWQMVYDIANAGPTTTSVPTNCAAAVAVSTEYALAFRMGSDRVCRFFVNGILAGATPALTSLSTLIPYIGVLSAVDATAKTLVVRDQAISRNI